MKKNKRIMKAIVTLVLVMSMNVTVFAESTEERVDGSLLTDASVSEVSTDIQQKGNILDQATIRLSDNGNGSVNVYGAVFGSVTCDKITLKMTVQRYSNGSWYDVRTYSDTAYNTALFTKSYNLQVTRGYTYRMKAACVGYKNGVAESKTPITDGIYVD